MDSNYAHRRYLINFETRRLPHIFTDVLVIGSGVAGLRAGIEAAQSVQTIVLSKAKLMESNSYYAQGGLAAALAKGDSVEAHVRDTLTVGAGLSDEAIVRQVVSAAPQHVQQMQQWGVQFDTDGGAIALGREGGHNADRIVHANGDATGKALTEVLAQRARACPELKLFDECFAIDLLTDPPEGGPGATVVGAVTYHPRFGLQLILARQTILAGGGAGMLWRETSNPSVATADAIAMGFRAGALLGDVEMMQFHPTTLYVAGATRLLISEAVRGEGAYLLDRRGLRFMPQYHTDAELAPRDVVSRAIVEQMVKTNSTHVLLDVRHFKQGYFAQRFPTINRQCRDFGIDPATDLIPVHPAAHYMIGGVCADADGRTDLNGLLAAGEASCTGLHGANRLASNSLSEALVYGQRTGQLAAQAASASANAALKPMAWTNPVSERTELDLIDIRNSLRSVMWRNVGIVRRGERLAETLEIISFWGRYVLDKTFHNTTGWEVQNMLTASYLVAQAAFRRQETRGVHYREDFPQAEEAWRHHQNLRRHGDQIEWSS